MRKGLLLVPWVLLCLSAAATAQVSFGIGFPNTRIEINLSLYPELAPVPGYPVYYAPELNLNYFFYDGMYWVYQADNWYASSWYNGPWAWVAPESVPVYILRVPVGYYRRPPRYFRGWQPDAPPRWNEHWGDEWAQHRRGWDHWNRDSVQVPAPLPAYQQKYSGDRYPKGEQQELLQGRNYRYQPRDPVVRQQYQTQRMEDRSPFPQNQGNGMPRERSSPLPLPQLLNPLPNPSATGHALPLEMDNGDKGWATPNPSSQQRRVPPLQSQNRQRQRVDGEENIPPGKGVFVDPDGWQGRGQERERDSGNDRGQGHRR